MRYPIVVLFSPLTEMGAEGVSFLKVGTITASSLYMCGATKMPSSYELTRTSPDLLTGFPQACLDRFALVTSAQSIVVSSGLFGSV